MDTFPGHDQVYRKMLWEAREAGNAASSLATNEILKDWKTANVVSIQEGQQG